MLFTTIPVDCKAVSRPVQARTEKVVKSKQVIVSGYKVKLGPQKFVTLKIEDENFCLQNWEVNAINISAKGNVVSALFSGKRYHSFV